MTTTPLKTFVCYAREDRPSLELLMGHLAVFERSGAVRFWYDREITGGKDWDDEIRFNLKTADIVLLLISPDFFLSDYIHSVELTEALQRDRAGEALVVPVILKKCLWHKHPEIARLQALPTEARPVFDKNYWTDPHDGFYDVAENFDRILDNPDTGERRRRREERLSKEKASEQKRGKRETEVAEKKRKAEEAARSANLPGMVFVRGGAFQMGEKGVADPVHTVTLADFEIGKYPVTQKLWREITGNNPSYFKDCDDCPVENVSWNDVQDFLKKLNAKFPGKNYRLPTEAEWEYAARGGSQSKGYTYSGSDDLNEVGWYKDNAGGKTHPVGQKKANELGLYDMSGNVWEWCADWYGDYPGTAQTNPVGPASGSNRVYRGGSWGSGAEGCRVSARDRWKPGSRRIDLGFRVASSPQ